MKFKNLKKYGKRGLILIVVSGLLWNLWALSIFIEGRGLIYHDDSSLPEYPVGIVFGAGLREDGTPSDILKDRLITAGNLYHAGVLDKILVSGDNSRENYDEPQAMYDYLVETMGVPTENVIRDYAGRRTYDTCARAHEIWGITKALLITQGYHLPRALFLCSRMGIESRGYSATRQAYRGETYYHFREWIALNVALFDFYTRKPDTIGGSVEGDLLEEHTPTLFN